MSPTSARTRHPGHVVTAIVVCRDGAKRLPKTLDALAHQVRRADRVVAVDLGSTDRTVAVATDRLGGSHVVEIEPGAGIGAAVAAGLELVAKRPDRRNREEAPVEWLWVLHDDSAPEPEALDELLLRVVHSPSVWLAGPKVLDWDGALLLQAGLTIDSSGRVDTGLDRREPDQGQRDDADEVLAVGVAGSLIRRDVWESLGGMDPQFAEFGAELDLGWRVNAAGGRVVVVPRAVLRHDDAGCVAGRPAGSPTRVLTVRRRNGMRVVLANTADWLVPLLMVRYVVAGLLQSVALVLLSRRPREAAAELRAVGQVVGSPKPLIAARRSRADTREVDHGDLRRLFPASGRWLPSLAAMRAQSAGTPDAPVSRRRVAVESGPVSEEVESLSDEISAVGEFLRRPASLLFVVMSLFALIAGRHVLSGSLHGGRLLAAPAGAGDLWSSYFSAWHPSSVGSTTPASPSLALLAALSTLLLGKAWLAIDVLVLGAVPLAALSAFTSLRVVTTAVRIRVWVAVVYALLPAVTGAVASGRLDVIVAAIVLPRVARSIALAWQPDAIGTLRGRTVRAGLWLAVATAFAPLVWLIAALVCGGLLAVAYLAPADESGTAIGERLRIAAGIVVIPLVVLMPWTWHVVAHPSILFAGSGLPDFYGARSAPSGLLIALLHADGPAQPPFWVGIPIVGAIVLGLQRDSRVAAARLGAAVFVLGVVIAIAMTRGSGVTAGFPTSRHWPGIALLIAGSGALLTAVVAAVGARPALRDQSFGWRQPLAVGVVALALASTGTLVVHWLVRGVDKPLRGDDPSVLPLYVQAQLDLPTAGRALILGGDAHLVDFALVRTPGGPLLGSGDQPPTSTLAATRLGEAVQDLVAGRPGAGAQLVPFGIDYVVAPSRTARHIASQLGRASTLTVIPVPSATVWRSSLESGRLTMLTGPAAAAANAGEVPAKAPARVLAIDADRLPKVPASTAYRLLVLAEPADSRWHATLNGERLESATAYGWAQAFVLPSRGGAVAVSFDSGARHWWLIAELIALVAVVLYGAGAGPHTPRRDAL